jgi:hypothetical protein
VKLQVLGDHPLAHNADGSLKHHIGAVFPDEATLITGPGIHALLKLQYLEHVEGRIGGPLARDERRARLDRSVDLTMREDTVYIRPDGERMDLAFAADELLQQVVPKPMIRFLGILDENVRQAVKQRGECWRINTLPRSAEEMKRMIRAARGALGAGAVYYHSMEAGTRYLTFQEFSRLGQLPAAQLAACLCEVQSYSARLNEQDRPEVSFFEAEGGLGPADFAGLDFSLVTEGKLREMYRALKDKFQAATKPEFRTDDDENVSWRLAMFMALLGAGGRDEVSEEILLGLSPEFHLRVQWLPGARLESGELIYDSVFDDPPPPGPEGESLCDEKVRSFIFNLLREQNYQVEYLNIARLPESLSFREAQKGRATGTAVHSRKQGRRGVYVAELKEAGRPRETVKFLRMQKWDVREHLEDGKDLLRAMTEAQEYTEYVLDRHFGCKQLGMDLLPIRTGTVTEHWGAQLLRLTYFERDYAYGLATDKIPPSRYSRPGYALRLARLLGQAAALNVVVGRVSLDGGVLFDDGDEVAVEDQPGLPERIIVADNSGSFADYVHELEHFAAGYAKVVSSRAKVAPDLRGFSRSYLAALAERLEWLQEQYRQRRRAFDTLFRHRKHDPGSFADRWEKVLARLDQAKPGRFIEACREALKGVV